MGTAQGSTHTRWRDHTTRHLRRATASSRGMQRYSDARVEHRAPA